MVEVATLETLSPKELGKHLREVRRRKGLSLSEVARGAGLTRRELNAYEKGRTAIPDSDLFVLAGSCGVDVAELRVPITQTELEAAASFSTELVPASTVQPAPTTIEDMVAQLRRSQMVPEPIIPEVPEVLSRQRLRALGVSQEAPPEPPEHEWLTQIDPMEGVQWPGDASIVSPSASAPHAPAQPVDVFEELARLGDPVDSDPVDRSPVDLTPAPEDSIAGTDPQPYDQWSIPEPEGALDAQDRADGEPVLVEMPQDAMSEATSASDAPPIDVAMRGESFTSPWDSLRGSQALTTPVRTESVSEEAKEWSYVASSDVATDQFPDTGTWDVADPSAVVTPDTHPDAFEVNEDDDWIVAAPGTVAMEPLAAFDPRFAVAPAESGPGGWVHDPDPDATSSGFYIDWGEPETDGADAPASGTSAWELPDAAPETLPERLRDLVPDAEDQREVIAGPWLVPVVPEADDEQDRPPEVAAVSPYEWIQAPEPTAVELVQPFETFEPALVEPVDPFVFEPVEIGVVPAVEELPFISWRPPSDDEVADDFATALEAVPLDEEPEPDEQFVVAGAEWILGNAVPLVEVRNTGSLVMRRADERWALADVTATIDFAMEVYVDLRSGPGFGVLFRADIDGDGRMSGYSFDVDPVYEGGGYLVREWRNDRELWDPIAHVTASDPAAMHGLLAVRLTVDNDSLVASVNGEPVLTVASLKQASVDRGREGASGDRVGIQAWSSTDLVIDQLRVAPR